MHQIFNVTNWSNYFIDENDELKKRVNFLEQQNFNLMAQLRKLQETVMSVSSVLIYV